MSDFLPFIVIGLVAGGVYCLAGLGLVLTYRTSGMFNFAHGGIGMWATYIFFTLRQHVPTAVAFSLAVFVVAPLMGVVIDRVLFRRLEGGGRATSYVVASLGLLVALQSLAVLFYGGETRVVDAIFPRRTYKLLGVQVGIDQTLVVLIAVGAGLGLIAFFRFTQMGLRTRAVVSDRTLTDMTGVNASFVTTFSWMVGATFAALCGILFAPFINLNAMTLTLLVIASFGAVAVGRLVSFPVTAVAAFGLAVLAGVVTKEVGAIHSASLRASLAGLPTVVPYVAILVSLLFASRKGSLQELTTTRPLMRKGRRARGVRFQFPYRLLTLFVGVAVVLPHFLSGYRIVTLTGVVAMVLLFSSLSLLVGLSRQVSLAHSVFVVFGATTLAHLLKAGVPYPLALLLAGLLFVPVGALIAIPAIRLSGLYLALATFAFALLSEALFTTGFAFGQEQLVRIPRPGYLVGDLPLFYFTLAVTVAGVVAVELIRVSRLGRMLTALADSPKAVQSLGMSPLVARVITFCVSAFLAAVAGGLLGTMVQVVSQDTYNAFTSLVWLTVLVAVGSRTLGGTVLAAALFVGVPAVVESQYVSPAYLAIYLGVAAVFFAQTSNGLVGLVRMPDFKGLAAAARSKLESNRSLERYVRTIGAEGVPAAEVS